MSEIRTISHAQPTGRLGTFLVPATLAASASGLTLWGSFNLQDDNYLLWDGSFAVTALATLALTARAMAQWRRSRLPPPPTVIFETTPIFEEVPTPKAPTLYAMRLPRPKKGDHDDNGPSRRGPPPARRGT